MNEKLNNNLDPKIWGPKAWFFIESLIRGLPDNINQSLEDEIKKFFYSLKVLLPCEACRNHYIEYINETNLIRLNFSKKIYVLTWVNNLHNKLLKYPRTLNRVNGYYDNLYKDNITNLEDMLKLAFIIALLVYILKFIFNNVR